MYYINVQN